MQNYHGFGFNAFDLYVCEGWYPKIASFFSARYEISQDEVPEEPIGPRCTLFGVRSCYCKS